MSLFYLSFKTFFQNVLEHSIAERSGTFNCRTFSIVQERSSTKVLRQEGDTIGEEFVNYLEQIETNSQTVEIGEAIVGSG